MERGQASGGWTGEKTEGPTRVRKKGRGRDRKEDLEGGLPSDGKKRGKRQGKGTTETAEERGRSGPTREGVQANGKKRENGFLLGGGRETFFPREATLRRRRAKRCSTPQDGTSWISCGLKKKTTWRIREKALKERGRSRAKERRPYFADQRKKGKNEVFLGKRGTFVA